MIKTIFSLGLCVSLAQTSVAQLPAQYITKVSFLEQRLVSFEMISENEEVILQSVQAGEGYPPSPYGIDCLTLAELSRYHGHTQHINMVQYIDMDGELLSDKRITYEENVRDAWMKPYSRILLGKELYQIYGENNELLYSYPKTQFSDSLNPVEPTFLSEEDAANFQHIVLDNNFYQQSMDEFQSMIGSKGELINEGGVLLALVDSFALLYDHNLKLSVFTEYDWNKVNKKKESVVIYGLTDDGSGYAPLQEIISEWFQTLNGCCIRKTTVILREQYLREVNEEYVHYVNPFSPDQAEFGKKNEEEEYSISTISGTASFMIQNEKLKGETLHIAIYDMAGKLLAKQNVTEGTPIPLPAARAGLYLIEVIGTDGTTKLVRQVIQPNSGNTF